MNIAIRTIANFSFRWLDEPMNRVQLLVSQNIKAHRQRRELTQSELSRATGLSQSFLVQLEKGNRFPSPESIEKICQALDVQPFELFLEKSTPSAAGAAHAATPVDHQRYSFAERLQQRVAAAIQEVLEESDRA